MRKQNNKVKLNFWSLTKFINAVAKNPKETRQLIFKTLNKEKEAVSNKKFKKNKKNKKKKNKKKKTTT